MTRYASPPAEPHRGETPRPLSSTVPADVRATASHLPPATQMAARMRTAYVDLTVVDGVLHGRPRGGIGHRTRITGDTLRQWSQPHLQPFERLDPAGWDTTARLLTEWVVERDAHRDAQVPAAEQAARTADTARAAAARRAQLVADRARLDAQLADLDPPGDVTPNEPPSTGPSTGRRWTGRRTTGGDDAA